MKKAFGFLLMCCLLAGLLVPALAADTQLSLSLTGYRIEEGNWQAEELEGTFIVAQNDVVYGNLTTGAEPLSLPAFEMARDTPSPANRPCAKPSSAATCQPTLFATVALAGLLSPSTANVHRAERTAVPSAALRGTPEISPVRVATFRPEGIFRAE